MARRVRFKPTLRQQMRSNHAALSFMAGAAPEDKQDSALEFVRSVGERLPAAPKPRAAPRQLEAPVVAAISDLLAVHPRVAFAVRQNTGSASYEAASGKWAPVNFYNLLTHSAKDITITDFWGILRNGKPFAVEAKAPGFKEPRTDREFRQAAFLMLVRNLGGIGIFATSADDVANALR